MNGHEDGLTNGATASHSSLELSPTPFERPGRGVRLRRWWLNETLVESGRHPGPHTRTRSGQAHWFRVMCLTGLDYFSTLGYQPALAALAVGAVAPIATVVLVLVTLCAALPIYRRVVNESPHGAGSIAMLAKLLPGWRGKIIVLVILGFAVTDFMITMTLSTSDATAHLVENPFAPPFVHDHRVGITLVFLAVLGLVFLRGFSEAVSIATALVVAFLALNMVVLVTAVGYMVTNPVTVGDWWSVLITQPGNPFLIIAVALIAFPKIALGLSGFETGVAVMPHIKGKPGVTEESPVGRIRGAGHLLTTFALLMSVFLMVSALVTAVLVPAEELQPGGAAQGRALAYLAHSYLSEGFGRVDDLVTTMILWFARASAMAGLFNLVPRYLSHYVMAPSWARVPRPLVVVLTGLAFLITILFGADVEAQGGAYATGVLVLITSASIAVTLSAAHRHERKWVVRYG